MRRWVWLWGITKWIPCYPRRQEHRLKAKLRWRSQVGAFYSCGTRSTIYGGPADGNLIPADLLNLVAQDIQQRDGSTIKGWIEVSTIVKRKDLVDLINDPAVYTVDVTESILRNSITSAKLSAAGANEGTVQAYTNDQMQIQISRLPVYWFLEDYGLVDSK